MSFPSCYVLDNTLKHRMSLSVALSSHLFVVDKDTQFHSIHTACTFPIELQFKAVQSSRLFHRCSPSQESFVVSLGVGPSNLQRFSPEGPLLLSSGEMARWIYLWGRQLARWPWIGGDEI